MTGPARDLKAAARSVVLLSAGLDSTISLAWAARETKVVLALTFDYGQRAACREVERAARIAAYYGIPHRFLPLRFLGDITFTSLVNREENVPALEEADLDQVEGAARESALRVWVPNRNGLFINVAACFAEAMGAGLVITGFNREEAATFPDNSSNYVEAANMALSYSTMNGVKVFSPTQELDKPAIFRLGVELGAPLDLIWSCYHGGESMCGSCESCRRLGRARREAGTERVSL